MSEKQILTQKEDHGNTIFAWSFPEYIKYERTIGWYLGAVIIGGGLFIYALATKNYLFGVIIFMIGVIVAMNIVNEPRTVSFKITDDGIELDKNFYPYKLFMHFWIVYEPPEIKTLYLDFLSTLRPKFSIPLMDQNPIRIRETLLRFIKEDLTKEKESGTDEWGKLLKI